MSKSTHFSGQPIYGQLINLIDRRKVLEFCETVGKKRNIKHSDGWQILLTMLYAVIKHLDSLREISLRLGSCRTMA